MRRLVGVAVLALVWGAGCERGIEMGGAGTEAPSMEGTGGSGSEGQQAGTPRTGTGGSGADARQADARPPAGTPEAWQGCAPGAQQPQAAAAQTVAGTVRSATRGTLTIEESGGRLVELSTDTRTCVLQAGRSVAPEALREGAEVRAGYEVRDGQPVARLVQATAEAGADAPGSRGAGAPQR